MQRNAIAACSLLGLFALGCSAQTGDRLTREDKQSIAHTVGLLFDEIAATTNTLDLDRMLGYYRNSDDLTYVARGRITRSYQAFEEIVRTQFGGVTKSDLSWTNRYVDVLSPEVAIVTADYEFKAVVGPGTERQTSGVFTTVFVLRDGAWQVEHVSHSFPIEG